MNYFFIEASSSEFGKGGSSWGFSWLLFTCSDLMPSRFGAGDASLEAPRTLLGRPCLVYGHGRLETRTLCHAYPLVTSFIEGEKPQGLSATAPYSCRSSCRHLGAFCEKRAHSESQRVGALARRPWPRRQRMPAHAAWPCYPTSMPSRKLDRRPP